MELTGALGIEVMPTTILYDARGQGSVALCRRPRLDRSGGRQAAGRSALGDRFPAQAREQASVDQRQPEGDDPEAGEAGRWSAVRRRSGRPSGWRSAGPAG